jgi:hypothetical protein
LVRRAKSEGLKGVLESDRDFSLLPEDVRSKPLTLEFPQAQDGESASLELTVRIDSPDFEPKSQSKTMQVPMKGDSEPLTFLLTPTQLGELRINVELYAGTITLLSRILRTHATYSDRILTGSTNTLITIPLMVFVHPDQIDAYPSEGSLLDRILEEGRVGSDRPRDSETVIDFVKELDPATTGDEALVALIRKAALNEHIETSTLTLLSPPTNFEDREKSGSCLNPPKRELIPRNSMLHWLWVQNREKAYRRNWATCGRLQTVPLR